MSAKVLNGREAAGAKLVRWPSVHDTVSHEHSVGEPVPPEPLPEVHAPPAQLAALEMQLVQLRSENEERVNEALVAGRQEGEASARQSLGQNLSVEVDRIKQLGKELLASGPALRKQAEADVVRLAVAIARRILHREIQIDHDALQGLAKAALSKIDQREIHIIRTHPDNVDLLGRILEQGRPQNRIEIAADSRLDRGALIIETARGQLDASVETHLDEIERGFADLVGEAG